MMIYMHQCNNLFDRYTCNKTHIDAKSPIRRIELVYKCAHNQAYNSAKHEIKCHDIFLVS